MALLAFVEKYWNREDLTEEEPERHEKFRVKLVTIYTQLCFAFDGLVETHCTVHMPTANVTDEATSGYFAWCNAREHMLCPNSQYHLNTHYTEKPYWQYVFRAMEHLSLRMGEEASLKWAAAICAFYNDLRAMVRNCFFSAEVEHIEEEFLLEIPNL
ncbi:hypothetical protein PENCOP_c013G02488 [Penicillium coprophilum]|uniref:Uncharacterized protein n=1 Tax=Penicillium coprophilum TaxID=36646 RepID=A0A1V6UAM7_9EURO|nr:hypothetical protein PENCOP_c013G02488 [Penicillium coprophilum]